MIWQWYIDELRIYHFLGLLCVCVGFLAKCFMVSSVRKRMPSQNWLPLISFAWLYVIGQLQRSVEVPYAVFLVLSLKGKIRAFQLEGSHHTTPTFRVASVMFIESLVHVCCCSQVCQLVWMATAKDQVSSANRVLEQGQQLGFIGCHWHGP